MSNSFLAFRDIETSKIDDAIVVDWDSDEDLEVILRTRNGLHLFDLKPGGHFVRMEPSPFKGVGPIGDCMPAVVDWDQDGKVDLVVGAEDSLRKE